MKVQLDLHEIEMAVHVGLRRRLEALRLGMKDRHGYTGENAWEQDIQAAAAELALAKSLGRYWDGSVNTLKRGDVGELQVRFTTLEYGCLIVREKDSDTDTFVLVTGTIPDFNVVGYMTGAVAKQGHYRMEPAGRPPAFFVPQDKLAPL